MFLKRTKAPPLHKQRGQTVRIIRGAFRGYTGRVQKVDRGNNCAEVAIPPTTPDSQIRVYWLWVHLDDLIVETQWEA